MLNKIRLTYHVIERFFERFPKVVSEHKLVNDVDMSNPSRSNVWKLGFVPMLEKATENRTFLNNSAMMVKMYERYGYDTKLKFLDNVEARARFVLREAKDGDKWVLVTIMDMEYDRIRSNVKYNQPKNTLGAVKERAQERAEIRALSKPVAPVKKRVLIWQESGRVRDEMGLIVTAREQINKLKLRVKCRDVEETIRGRMRQSDYEALPADKDGFCTVVGVAHGYELVFKAQKFGTRHVQIQAIYDVM